MSGDYDVLITMDRGIEFQQPIAQFPFGVIITHAASNRLQHLKPLVPALLTAVSSITEARFDGLEPNYDPRDGQIWHVPGFSRLGYRCHFEKPGASTIRRICVLPDTLDCSLA